MLPTWWDEQRSPGRSWRFIPAYTGNSGWQRRRAVCRQVHPRVCGELPAIGKAGARSRGSSPRVRGTRLSVVPFRHLVRFIPACAGNSWQDLDIPDRRGGSSPRVRGTHQGAQGAAPHGRFIPACAGNSCATHHRRKAEPVHPRVCGELGIGVGKHAAYAGSSPRVRGTPPKRRLHGADDRFIPACAGNSYANTKTALMLAGSSPRVRGTRGRRSGTRATISVHPRVCGELQEMLLGTIPEIGSSPRVRGTRAARTPRSACSSVHPRVCGELSSSFASRRVSAGFIPACAGNSCRPDAPFRMFFGSSPRVRGTQQLVRFAASQRRVHPRVCGELKMSRGLSGARAGSSPRVRGTRASARGTCAKRPVHPRVCGELRPRPAQGFPAAGSSPRVRGTRSWSRTAGRAWTVHPRVCGELS